MIRHKLVGNAMQMLVTELSAGEEVYGVAGKFLWKTPNVKMETRFSNKEKHAGKGFLDQAIGTAIDVGKRKIVGESLAFVYFSPQESEGMISFAQMIPGEIKNYELDGSMDIFVQSEGLLAAESTVDFDVALTKRISAGVFGGEGLILEKFGGVGSLFLGSCGNFIELNPADFGGTIQLDTGCLVAFEDSIDYDIELIGGLDEQGIKNVLFGGEGIFFATLRGNGKVWIQSMNITTLSRTIMNKGGQSSAEDRTDLGGLLSRL